MLTIYFGIVGVRGKISAFACVLSWTIRAGMIVAALLIMRAIMHALR
jgi:hypothetical protein